MLLSGLLLPVTKGIEFILSFQIKEYLRQEILQFGPTKISATAKILKIKIDVTHNALAQGGRTWQPFVGSKNGNENYRQARIYNFCVKCVVFARNRKFAKLTQ